MNWEDVNETSKEKVESLVASFNEFIYKHHEGEDPTDKNIREEWEKFKLVIEKKPADTQMHNKYVLALRNELLKKDIILAKQAESEERERLRKLNRPKLVMDKGKLINISKELKRTVLRNTQNPLNLL